MADPVYVNARFIDQKLTGVQRYAHELCRRLQGKVHLLDPPRVCSKSRVLEYFWEQVGLPLSLARNSLLWSPTGSGPLLKHHVVTIHDGAVLSHPEWFKRSFVLRRRFLLPLLLQRVCKIITVSQFSKEHIRSHARVDDSKIEVVYNGVDHSRFYPKSSEEVEKVRDRLEISERYVLGLGSLDPRKNFHRLLRAWERAEGFLSEKCVLVIAGGSGRNFRNVSLKARSDRVKLLGYVADRYLPALYSGADAFVYPSVFEGFGLPVLEAMACGTPVITSNVTSLPEVAGEAAVLVDPFDVEAMAEAIVRVVEDNILHDQLRQKGLERARQFTWERAAEETWQVLQSAMV